MQLLFGYNIYYKMIYTKESEQKEQAYKKKRQQLNRRLNRIATNHVGLMEKLDKQIDSIRQVKENLDSKGDKINDLEHRYEQVMTEMAIALFGNQNPLKKMGNKTYKNSQQPKKVKAYQVVPQIKKCKNIVILTGAGVSVQSGVPTFRGNDGLYNVKFTVNNKQLQPEQFITLKNFNSYPSSVWDWYLNFRNIIISKKPSRVHKLIHELIIKLMSQDKKVELITTNIDQFHKQCYIEDTKNKLKYPIRQIHGSVSQYLCMECNGRTQFKQGNITDHKQMKSDCGSDKCRPNIMFFDENYTSERFGAGVIEKIQNKNLHKKKQKLYEMVIAIGTSLKTSLSVKIVSQAAKIIEINPNPQIEIGPVYQITSELEDVLKQIINKL